MQLERFRSAKAARPNATGGDCGRLGITSRTAPDTAYPGPQKPGHLREAGLHHALMQRRVNAILVELAGYEHDRGRHDAGGQAGADDDRPKITQNEREHDATQRVTCPRGCPRTGSAPELADVFGRRKDRSPLRPLARYSPIRPRGATVAALAARSRQADGFPLPARSRPAPPVAPRRACAMPPGPARPS